MKCIFVIFQTFFFFWNNLILKLRSGWGWSGRGAVRVRMVRSPGVGRARRVWPQRAPKGGSHEGGPEGEGVPRRGVARRMVRENGGPINKRNHHTLTSEKWPEQPNLRLDRQNKIFLKKLKCYFKIIF